MQINNGFRIMSTIQIQHTKTPHIPLFAHPPTLCPPVAAICRTTKPVCVVETRTNMNIPLLLLTIDVDYSILLIKYVQSIYVHNN